MKMKFRILLLFVVIAMSACSPASKTLTVNEAWARPAQTGKNGAVYFIIENGTNTADMLLSANADIADSTEAHMSTVNDQDMASMQMQEAVHIPAGEAVIFKPGGLHLMLVNLKRDLKIGDIFMLTLHFESAGEMTLKIKVQE